MRDELDCRRRAISDSASIDGFPIALACHRQETLELGPAQVAAEELAKRLDRRRWASIHHRKGYDLGRTYMVMSFDNFVDLLDELPA